MMQDLKNKKNIKVKASNNKIDLNFDKKPKKLNKKEYKKIEKKRLETKIRNKLNI